MATKEEKAHCAMCSGVYKEKDAEDADIDNNNNCVRSYRYTA